VATAHRNSSSKLDGPVLRSDLSPTINAIVAELQRTFFGVIPATAIAQCATRAVQDLLGSICLQALPEMAIRLATVRLETERRDTERSDTGQVDAERLETVPPADTVRAGR
jgi:hypothetical protein